MLAHFSITEHGDFHWQKFYPETKETPKEGGYFETEVSEILLDEAEEFEAGDPIFGERVRCSCCSRIFEVEGEIQEILTPDENGISICDVVALGTTYDE